MNANEIDKIKHLLDEQEFTKVIEIVDNITEKSPELCFLRGKAFFV